MLAIVPLLAISAIFFGKFIRKNAVKTQDELAKTNVIVEETLQTVNVVKAFTNEGFEVNRYAASLQKVLNFALKSATYRGAFISFIILTTFGSIVGVVWYGGSLVQQGELPFQMLFAFILYTVFIGGSVGGLGDMYGQIQRTIGTSERILEISGPQGVDAFIDNTGNPLVIEMGYEVTKAQGRVVLVGVPKQGSSISIYSLPLHFGKGLSGSHGGEAIPYADIPRYRKLLDAGRIELHSLITDSFSLAQINEAIDAMRSGRVAGRCMIKIDTAL